MKMFKCLKPFHDFCSGFEPGYFENFHRQHNAFNAGISYELFGHKDNKTKWESQT
jgi:hypothetical protein